MVGEFVGIDYLAMLARLREEDLPELRDVLVIGTPEWDAFLDAPDVEIDVDAIAYDDPSFIVYTSGHHRLPEGRRALQPGAAQRVLDLRGDGHRRAPAA